MIVLLLQGVALLWTLITTVVRAVLHLPVIGLRLLRSVTEDDTQHVRYYEGHVMHQRKQPVLHSFRYPVRIAVVNLDRPPCWWQECAADHLTAAAARRLAGTTGDVWLLTTPPAASYSQNPISVYYCYRRDHALACCIAEVTNTPWGERVTFLFNPDGDEVPKALHVSPLMDMQSTWRLRAPAPKDTLVLVVGVEHPVMGKFFIASLEARRSAINARAESGGLRTLIRFGFMPHRIAMWIYWHAVLLLWKGVPFYGPPCKAYRTTVQAKATHPPMPDGSRYLWREAQEWPWTEETT